MAAIFDGLNGAQAIYVGVGYGFIPNFGCRLTRNLVGERLREGLAAAQERGDRIVTVQQVTSVVQPMDLGLTPALACNFPNLGLHALSPVEFCAFYGTDEAPAPDRIFEIDLGQMMRSQRKAGFSVDVAGYIEQNFRREILFNTPGHPGGVLGALLTEGVLDQLQALDPAYADPSLVQAVRAHEGINFMSSMPLPLDVVESLKLDWTGPDAELARLLALAQTDDLATDHSAELIRSLRGTFEDNTQFWRVAAAVHAARHESKERLEALRRLVDLNPGSSYFWTELSTALRQAGEVDPADRLSDDVDQFYGDRMERDYILTGLHNVAGRHEEALEHATKYFDGSGAWYFALLGVIPTLALLGRRDEIESYAERARAAWPTRIGQIDHAVATYGGLGASTA